MGDLMTNEVVKFRTRLRWSVLLLGPCLIALGTAMPVIGMLILRKGLESADDGIATYETIMRIISLVGNWMAIFGAFNTVYKLILYKTSEFGISNHRLIVKSGFFRKMTREQHLAELTGFTINQSIAGRWLGYGSITIIWAGGAKTKFKQIRAPIELRQAASRELEAQRSQRQAS